MKLRLYVFAIVISFLCLSCGLTNKAVLYFNDGTIKTGLGEIVSHDQVKFKTENTKAEKFDFSDLEKVEIQSGDEKNTYVYIKVKENDTKKVLQQVSLGKVNLYKKVTEGHMVGAPMSSGGGAPMMSSGYSYSISNYYVRKTNEIEATHLGSTLLFSKNFKKAASEYFSDCPTLVNKIQNKEFKKRHIEKVVTFYNTKCK